MNKINTQKIHILAITAVMSTLSVILTFISVPVPFFPQFLKFDLSEVPALIVAFSLGPLPGLMVELIKNLIHILFTNSAGIGELANFLVNGAFVFTSAVIYKYKKSRTMALVSMATGTIVMTLLSLIVNYYILFPLYRLIIPLDALIYLCKSINNNIDSLFDIIVICIVPFNLLKGFLTSVLTFVLYKKLSPLIKEFTVK